ncbi:MAG: hypothetical protein IJT34_10715 [Butyrivibrio sp.]|nr:hypothetical protein [Butyrivibrio sp.]
MQQNGNWTQVPQEVRKAMNNLYYNRTEYQLTSGSVLSEVMNELQADPDYIYFYESPSGDRGEELFQEDESPWRFAPIIAGSRSKIAPLQPDVDPQEMEAHFRRLLEKTKQLVNARLRPGDDLLRDQIHAALIHPMELALKGWYYARIRERLNIATFQNFTQGCAPMALSDRGRRSIARCEEIYPVNRVSIGVSHLVDIHLDYFDKQDAGTLTDKEAQETRSRIAAECDTVLANLDRMERIAIGSPEAQELDGILGNVVKDNRRRSDRGSGGVYADVEARIMGIRSGWPVDDLNGLSSFNILRESKRRAIFYNEDSTPRRVPDYKPGERKLLQRMDQLWDRISQTPVTSPAQRIAFLTEMRDLVQDGLDRGLIVKDAIKMDIPMVNNFSYILCDLDRCLSRQLLPVEVRAMEGPSASMQRIAALGQNHNPEETVDFRVMVQHMQECLRLQARLAANPAPEEVERINTDLLRETQQVMMFANNCLRDMGGSTVPVVVNRVTETRFLLAWAENERRRILELNERRAREAAEAIAAQQAQQAQQEQEEEQEQQQQQPPEDEMPLGDLFDGVYEEEANNRARMEREIVCLDTTNAAAHWFFTELADQLQAAAQATGLPLDPPAATLDSMFGIIMGQRDISFNQVLELNLGTDEQRRNIVTRFLEDVCAHPLRDDLSQEELEQNADWYGQIHARTAARLLQNQIPAFGPANIDELRAFAEGRSRMGRFVGLTADFMQNIQRLTQPDTADSRTRAAYVASFGGSEALARIQGQLRLFQSMQRLAQLAVQDDAPVHLRALAMHYLEQLHTLTGDHPLSEQPPTLAMRFAARAEALYAQMNNPEHPLPMEGAPAFGLMDGYISGRNPSPFSDAYMAQVERLANGQLSAAAAAQNQNAPVVRQFRQGGVDLARIYNVSDIAIRGELHPALPVEALTELPVERQQQIRRTFDQTLGNLIGISTGQALLAAERGEDAMDRFTVGGRPISQVVAERYPDNQNPAQMNPALMNNPALRRLAMEYTLLLSMTDPAFPVSFVPLTYNARGEAVEARNGRVSINTVVPFPAVQAQGEPTQTQRFTQDTDALNIVTRQLRPLITGLGNAYQNQLDDLRVLQAGYLDQQLGAQANAPVAGQLGAQDNAPAAGQAAEDPVHRIRRQYGERTERVASRMIVSFITGNRQEMAALARLLQKQANYAVALDGVSPVLPFGIMRKLSNSLRLGEAGAPLPAQMLSILRDDPEGTHPFPMVETALNAAEIQDAMLEYRRHAAAGTLDADQDRDLRNRLLTAIDRMEENVQRMRQGAGGLNRMVDLERIFGEGAVDRFVNGTPGARTILADLEGRRLAIAMGWPLADLDLVASFYTKRQLLQTAAQNQAPGSVQRLQTERALRTVQEICDYLEQTQVLDEGTRQTALEFIHSAGDALYNNTVACAGMADQGQLATMRRQLQTARDTDMPETQYRTAEELHGMIQAHPGSVEPLWAAPDVVYLSNRFVILNPDVQPEAAPQAAPEQPAGQAQEPAGQAQEPEQDPAALREAQRLSETALGFCDTQEDRRRIQRLEVNHLVGLLGAWMAGNRLTDDMRMYFLGKGSVTWTETVQDPNAAQGVAPRQVQHTVDLTTFDDVQNLNLLPVEARRQLTQQFLADLEAHPMDKDVDDATAEANAAYFAEIHRQAMIRAQYPGYPQLDLNDSEVVRQTAFGGNMIQRRAMFALNYSQDNTTLFVVRPGEQNRVNERARLAYIRAFGGHDVFAALKARQDAYQGITMLAQVAAAREGFLPLLKRVLGKHYLLKYDAEMRAIKAEDPENARIDMTAEMMLTGTALMNQDVVIPPAAGVTEQQLRDYLEGHGPSPFSEAYLQQADNAIRRCWMTVAEREVADIRTMIGEGRLDTTRVFNVSYIRIPRILDANARPVRYDRVPMTWRNGLNAGQRSETVRIFDETLGQFLQMGNRQKDLMLAREEDSTARFRINGMPVKEFMRMQLPPGANADQLVADEEVRMAALMTALADRAYTVDFVPLVYNAQGAIVEGAPLRIPLKAEPTVEQETTNADLHFPDNEAGLYYGQLGNMHHILIDLAEYDPGNPIFQFDEVDPEHPLPEGVEPNLAPMDMRDRYFISSDDDDRQLAQIGYMNYYRHNSDGLSINFSLVKGTALDGTMNETGRRNLGIVRNYIRKYRDAAEQIARKYERVDPQLAEFIRGQTDVLRLKDRDGTMQWQLQRNNLYLLISNQRTSIRATSRDGQGPVHVWHAMGNYPAGNPRFPLPQILITGRRVTLAQDTAEQAVREGTLSRRFDRTARRMLIAEMDRLEALLREQDQLVVNSGVEGSQAHRLCADLYPRCLDNPVDHASSLYARGTAPAWGDMAGRRALLANGWPISDLNLLADLYCRRDMLKASLAQYRTNKEMTPAENRAKERTLKVLEQIIKELDETPIRNAQDRKRLLQMIDSYGDSLYTEYMVGISHSLDTLRIELKQLIDRQPVAEEFLSEQELAEARDAYNRYQARKNGPDLDAPTINGPRTDEELAFLDAIRLAGLYRLEGRMVREQALLQDPLHNQTNLQLASFLNRVDQFYADYSLTEPAHAEQRRQALDAMVRDAGRLVEQVSRSIARLRTDTAGAEPSQVQKRQLEMLEEIRSDLDGMRRAHTAQLDLERRRRLELSARQQQQAQREADRQRFLQEMQDNLFAQDADGVLYGDTAFVMGQLTRAERKRVLDTMNQNLPEFIPVASYKGRFLPQVLADEYRLRDSRREEEIEQRKQQGAALQQARQDRRVAAQERIDIDLDEFFDPYDENRARLQEGLANDDLRLTMNFAEVMEEALLHREQAEQAKTRAEADPAATVEERTHKRIAARREAKRYDSMLIHFLAAFTSEELLRQLEQRKPQWFREVFRPVLDPRMAGVTDPVVIRSRQVECLKSTLSPQDLHALLDDLAETLPREQADSLRRELLNFKLVQELPMEQQTAPAQHDRIQVLMANAVAGDVADVNLVPLAPDDLEKYRQALQDADRLLESVPGTVRDENMMDRGIQERYYNSYRNGVVEEYLNSPGDEGLKLVAMDLHKNSGDFVAYGVQKGQETDRDRLINWQYHFSEQYLNDVADLMQQMEDMHIPVAEEFPGGDGRSLAFSGLVNAQDALEEALAIGDPKRIIEATDALKDERRNMDSLFTFARTHFPGESIPGNIDATRQANIPLQYSADWVTNSKLNGIHSLYSALRWAGCTLQEFRQDPNACLRRMYEKAMETMDPAVTMRGKRMGEILGTLAAQRGGDQFMRVNEAMALKTMIRRVQEALVMIDPDAASRKSNIPTYELWDTYEKQINSHIAQNCVALEDEKRGREVQELLTIVDPQALAENCRRMVMIRPLDARGRAVEPITASDYIATLPADFNGYQALTGRLEEMIADAVRTGAGAFQPADVMHLLENRQRALSLLLTTRAADAGKPGYELLVDEVRNMAQYYDAIRSRNAALPALTNDQKRTLRTQADEFNTKYQQAGRALSQEQRAAIAQRETLRTQQLQQLRTRIQELTRYAQQREQAFVDEMNQIERERRQPDAGAPAAYKLRRELAIREYKDWLLNAVRNGDLTSAYARQRIAELNTQQRPGNIRAVRYKPFAAQSGRDHMQRLLADTEAREVRREIHYDTQELCGLLGLTNINNRDLATVQAAFRTATDRVVQDLVPQGAFRTVRGRLDQQGEYDLPEALGQQIAVAIDRIIDLAGQDYEPRQMEEAYRQLAQVLGGIDTVHNGNFPMQFVQDINQSLQVLQAGFGLSNLSIVQRAEPLSAIRREMEQVGPVFARTAGIRRAAQQIEEAQRRQAAQAQEAQRVQRIEQRLTLRREFELGQAMELPLTLRLLSRTQDALDRRAQAAAAEHGNDADATYDSMLLRNDATGRMNQIVTALFQEMTAAQLQTLLIERLGQQAGSALSQRLQNRVPTAETVRGLNRQEQERLFAAVVWNLPDERRRQIMALDDAFVPVGELQLDRPADEAREAIEQQVTHDVHDRVEELLLQYFAEMGKYASDAPEIRGYQELREQLREADALLTTVKPEIRSRVSQVVGVDTDRTNTLLNQNDNEHRQRPENQYMTRLRREQQRISVVKPDRQADMRRTRAQNPVFGGAYVNGISAILERMDGLGLFHEGQQAEEDVKFYAFRQISQASARLREALRADMHVEANRTRLREELAAYKQLRQGMDDLMRMGRDTFSTRDYMDNLDVVRNPSVPWEYARDRVTSSQLNAVYLFGSILKAHHISIDEFRQNPDAVMQRIKEEMIRQKGVLGGYTQGASFGEIAAKGGCGYYYSQALVEGASQFGLLGRAITGMILAEPETDPDRKAHNTFLVNHIFLGDEMGVIPRQVAENSRQIKEAFQRGDRQGMEAIKALTIVPEQDFDANRMLSRIPLNVDGTRQEPFRLGVYLRTLQNFDYQAQATRLETMLRDAAATHAQIRAEAATTDRKRYPGIGHGIFNQNTYQPFVVIKARQQALSELLTLRAADMSRPGFAGLEDELLHMAQRYEALRQAQPGLQLPALTVEQKRELTNQANRYLDFKNNRTRRMEQREQNIVRQLKDEEKALQTATRNLENEIRTLEGRIGRRNTRFEETAARLMAKGNELTEAHTHHRPVERLMQDVARLNADLQGIAQEHSTFQAQLDEKRRRLSQLKIDHVNALVSRFEEGKLPFEYVSARLEQIAAGNMRGPFPPLFGDLRGQNTAVNSRRRDREQFLTNQFLAEQGSNVLPTLTARQRPERIRMAMQTIGIPEMPAPVQQVAAAQINPPQQVQNGNPPQQLPQNNNQPPVQNGNPPQQEQNPQVHDINLQDLHENVQANNQAQNQQNRPRRNSIAGNDRRPNMNAADNQVQNQQNRPRRNSIAGNDRRPNMNAANNKVQNMPQT